MNEVVQYKIKKKERKQQPLYAVLLSAIAIYSSWTTHDTNEVLLAFLESMRVI